MHFIEYIGHRFFLTAFGRVSYLKLMYKVQTYGKNQGLIGTAVDNINSLSKLVILVK